MTLYNVKKVEAKADKAIPPPIVPALTAVTAPAIVPVDVKAISLHKG